METFQIECLKDGTWSNEIPTCKSKNTPSVDYKDHELPSTGGIRAEPTQGGESWQIHSEPVKGEFHRHIGVGQKFINVSFSNKMLVFQKDLWVPVCFLNTNFTSACIQVAKFAKGIACFQVRN